MFQVGEERRDRLINVSRQRAMRGHVAMRIPVSRCAGVNQLNEAHPALGKPAGDKALPAKPLRAASWQAVELVRVIGFLAEVKRLRRRRLHSIGCFEGLDARRKLPVAPAGEQMTAIERGAEAELHLLQLCVGHQGLDVGHGLGAGHHTCALMTARQEIRRPQLSARVWQCRRYDHETRQVRIHGSEPVADP